MLVTIAGKDYFTTTKIGDFGVPISAFTESIDSYTGTIGDYGTKIIDIKGSIISLADIRDNKLRANTLNISKALQSSQTADFTILDEGENFSFQKGQPVILRNPFTYVVEFRGYIDNVESEPIIRNALFHNLKCVGTSYLTDKRIIKKSFEGWTIEKIVRWIYNNCLKAEGVRIGKIVTTGKVLDKKTFDLVTATDALTTLADLAGFSWVIDGDLKFFFQPAADMPAPWDVDDAALSSGVLFGLKVTRGGTGYRNAQYMRGGKAETSEQTEPFAGDGTRTSWNAHYPIKKISAIFVNGVPKTFAIQGQDASAYDFYYSVGSQSFSQKSSAAKLTSSDTIQLIYTGTYDLVVKLSNGKAILDRADIDQGSGKVETVIDAPDYTDEESLIAYGRALLASHSKETITINYKTLTEGLDIGQSQHICHPVLGVDDDFVISNIEIDDEEYILTYNITAVTGPADGVWQDEFGQKPLAQDTSSSTVLICEDLEARWRYSDYPNPFLGNAANLFRYIQVNSPVPYRIGITDLAMADDQIIVTGQIPAEDGVGKISVVSLWGGETATEEVDSGDRIWQGKTNITKSDLEILQFLITHNKYGIYPSTEVLPAEGGESPNGLNGAGIVPDDIIIGVV